MNSDAAETGIGAEVRWWNSIPAKLISGLLLLTVAAGTSVWLTVAEQQEHLFFEQQIREAGITSRKIAEDFAERMVGGGGMAVWSALSADALELRRQDLAMRILVILSDGKVMAGSDEAAIGTRIETRDNPECPGCESIRPEDFPAAATVSLPGGARGLRIVTPIPVTPVCKFCHPKEGDARSYVSIDFDLSPLDRAARQRQRTIVIMGLMSSIILAALVTILFRRLVMRPVDSLRSSMSRVASGDLSARTEVLGSDELGVLASHFNYMAARIEEQVTRIETAHTESDLLYSLVVEASKSLETSEVAAGVARVIVEKLSPQTVCFFLESAELGWVCVSAGRNREEVLEHGDGSLEVDLASGTVLMKKLLGCAPDGLVAGVLRNRELRLVREPGGLNFALPVVSESRLLGLLLCAGIPAGIRVDEDLLNNLGAHLTLAAVNSRNYTGAITDALTRLKNKRYGIVRIEEAVSFARRYSSPLALAMCDIDHFKRVNDNYGHLAGDAVLREVSRRIADCVRKSDIAVRFGGEEFMLILPQTDATALAVVGEKIRRAIEAAPVGLGAVEGTIALTLSVGIAAFRTALDSEKTLMERADAALYRAKEGGRNRVVIDDGTLGA